MQDLVDKKDLQDLLAVLKHKKRAGHPSKVLNKMLESAAICIILYRETNKTFKKTIKGQNIPPIQSTFKWIIYDY